MTQNICKDQHLHDDHCEGGVFYKTNDIILFSKMNCFYLNVFS